MVNILNEADFEKEVLQSDKPVVVDFYATWCGPCKILEPIFADVAGEMSDKAKFFKIDTDDNKGVSKQFGVRSIPTLMVFKNGEMVDKLMGVLPKEELQAKISSVI
ncbi:MAG: thioredoxin [Defluviitaleaceae bacterium]|nr:thioredoxin [Defluviitaleaceae bacterium]